METQIIDDVIKGLEEAQTKSLTIVITVTGTEYEIVFYQEKSGTFKTKKRDKGYSRMI